MHLTLNKDLPDSATTRKLLGYLYKNPRAQDTFAGIAEWWVLKQSIDMHISEIQAGLEELVRADLIRATTGRDTTVRYRVNPEKLAHIERLLSKSEKGE